MNLTITFPSIIAAATFLVLSITVGRWAGRLQKMLESHDTDIVSLRKDRHQLLTDVSLLQQRAEGIEDDVGELMHAHPPKRRRGE